MKKNLISSLFTVVFCLTMIIGVSFAAFTSSSGYTNNSISTGQVNFNLNLSKDGADVNRIFLENVAAGTEYDYTVDINNKSTINTAYRFIFDVTGGNEDIFNHLVITADNDVVEFNDSRGTTSWVTEIKPEDNPSIELSIAIKSGLSNASQLSNLKFDFEVEMIQDNFIEINSQDDFDKYSTFEYFILKSDITDLDINKSAYVDLGGYTVNNLKVTGDDETSVEIENGSIINLDVDNTNAVVYANCTFGTQAIRTASYTMEVNAKEFYFVNESTVNVDVNVYGGKIVLDTKASLNVTVKNSENELVLVTSETTVINKLTVSDDVTQQVVVENAKEITELVVENDLGNVSIDKTPADLTANSDFEYVSLSTGDVYYSTKDGKGYKNEAISFEDFLSNPKGTFYFASGVYTFTGNFEVENDLEVYGINEVVFEKASGTYSDNTFIVVSEGVTALFDNVSFEDTTNVKWSGGITSSGDLTLNNCSISGFTYMNVVVKGGTAKITNSTFTHNPLDGCVGDGVRSSNDAVVTIEGCVFTDYYSKDERWTSGSITATHTAKVTVSDVKFVNSEAAMVVSLSSSYGDNIPQINYSNCDFVNATEEYRVEGQVQVQVQ
ncbi:MAG: hypothetical protein R3Y60_03970 [bacterium]